MKLLSYDIVYCAPDKDKNDHLHEHRYARFASLSSLAFTVC